MNLIVFVLIKSVVSNVDLNDKFVTLNIIWKKDYDKLMKIL